MGILIVVTLEARGLEQVVIDKEVVVTYSMVLYEALSQGKIKYF